MPIGQRILTRSDNVYLYFRFIKTINQHFYFLEIWTLKDHYNFNNTFFATCKTMSRSKYIFIERWGVIPVAATFYVFCFHKDYIQRQKIKICIITYIYIIYLLVIVAIKLYKEIRICYVCCLFMFCVLLAYSWIIDRIPHFF